VTLGINVWELPSLGDGIAGRLFKDPENGGQSGYSILIKGTDPLVRKRFTLAHEIAHFILHRDSAGLEVSDDEFYRSRLSDTQEVQANKLAAQILMPMHLIQAMIASGTKEVSMLARVFQVSEAAMMIRLGIPVP
jgi:Zn-dependent peptidase ImmA (M78 family)